MQEFSYLLPEADSEVATYCYDSEDTLTAVMDPVAGTEFACYDALGRPFPGFRGRKVKGVRDPDAAADSASASAAVWVFCPVEPGRKSTFEIYVSPANGLNGRKWQCDYALSGATLTLATDPADTPLGPGLYNLGSVTVPASAAEFILRYRGGAAPRGIVLMEKASNT